MSLSPVKIDTFRLTASDGNTWETNLPGSAWGISRWALDAALAQTMCSMGVELRQEVTVRGIRGSLLAGFELETQSPTGSSTLSARAVIGAYGKRSSLDRALDRHFMEQPHPYSALKTHLEGPPLPARIELHTFPGGYCGMSEVEDGSTNVCLLVQTACFQQNGGAGPDSISRFITWMKGQNPHLGRWLNHARPGDESWYTISQIPFTQKQPVVGDILMAGDSAGVIAPLAGDGIAMALSSGRMAAQFVGGFLAGRLTPKDAKRQYAAQWQREFRTRLRLGRLLQPLMLNPRHVSVALRLLNTLPAVGDYLIRQTRDTRLIRQGV